jgi:hypothetical protein
MATSVLVTTIRDYWLGLIGSVWSSLVYVDTLLGWWSGVDRLVCFREYCQSRDGRSMSLIEGVGLYPGVVIVLLAFVCEYVDSSLGMGYGTTLTPLLVMLGLPAILLSELATGITAGSFHHGFGNVNLLVGPKRVLGAYSYSFVPDLDHIQT